MERGGRELITAAAIARLAGVGRAAVSNWRRRYPEFPQPAGGSPNSPTFDRAEVLTWLKETGKADQLATAGRTDGGTIRVGASGTSALETSSETMLAEAWKGLPERSVSDLLPGDLLARAMAALLPRSTAPEAADPAAQDGGRLESSDERYENLAGGGHYRGGSDNDPHLPVVLDPACGGGVALMAVADRFGAPVPARRAGHR